MYTDEENKKNARLGFKRVILLLALSIVASIGIGFAISQYAIKPYLAKLSEKNVYSYSVKVPQFNYYVVKIGQYSDEKDASYNLNLLTMKGIYGEILKDGENYILCLGQFMDKKDADDFSLKLNKSGINSSVALYYGPVYQVYYEKNSEKNVKEVIDRLNVFLNSLSHLSQLSYKIAFGTVSEKDIDDTEKYFKKYSNMTYNINIDENLKKILDDTKAINSQILNNFSDIKTSFELNDGNAYRLTQKLLMDSIKQYYDSMSSLK
ncbi:sporulation protein [Thermoanaerobacterium sp. PSU-2]|uniref:SPOR domain-containing protein n=1 Tax=Thermoanaerobacterium sp. PSU-2 TaxID=1930849 RepID=UPI000A155269|nr:SPOR domain-containing protein [Thermoanaerobacterium sp. PSU-2]ORX23502.1 sporulation protein [Thermoanaerobacterium sp. PSU-2]